MSRLRALFDRAWRALGRQPHPRLRLTTAGRGWVAYDRAVDPAIRSYAFYAIELLIEALDEAEAALNVVFGDVRPTFPSANPTVTVGFQTEHTLVRPGGRDSEGAEPGAVLVPGSQERYLVRIAGYPRLVTHDLVIEYSLANLHHVAASGRFAEYLEKTVHLAPLLRLPGFRPHPRPRPLVTLFADPHQARRQRFLEEAERAGLPVVNHRGRFDPPALEQLWGEARILINVHQTDHHQTLEELRVLPALLQGVVVVSEEVPLREHIPYSPFLVWAPYDQLVSTAHAVLERYDEHWQRLFGGPELPALIAAMAEQNRRNAAAAVAHLLRARPALERTHGDRQG